MKNPKFVIIGSGSQFTEFFLQEYFKYEKFKGSTLVFIDRKPERLKQEIRLAKAINDYLGWDVKIEGYSDRRQGLPGADFVYNFVAVNSKGAWAKEFEICAKHGIDAYEAYTIGAPGLSFSMRHVPLLLDICKDMEELCPNAWHIIDINPLAKVLSAIQKFTKVKTIGYCNGHEMIVMALEQFMNMTDRDGSQRDADPIEREFMVPAGRIAVELAGINHMQYCLRIYDAQTGEDLYPAVMEKINATKISDFPGGYRFSFEIAKLLKVIPSPADNHVGDYIWCVDKEIAKAAGLGPYPVEQWFGGKNADDWAKIANKITDAESAKIFVKQRRIGWMSTLIAHNMLSGEPKYFPALNVQNNGAISNISDDIIVEVPGVIGPDYVKAVAVGPLPDTIAPMCELHGKITNMAAEAAATGSEELALQALLLDPFIHSVTVAKNILADILAYNKSYDTRFK